MKTSAFLPIAKSLFHTRRKWRVYAESPKKTREPRNKSTAIMRFCFSATRPRKQRSNKNREQCEDS